MDVLIYLLNAWLRLWNGQFMLNRRCVMRAHEWTHSWSHDMDPSGLFYCTRGGTTGCTATSAVAEGPFVAMRARRTVTPLTPMPAAPARLPAISGAVTEATRVAVDAAALAASSQPVNA